MNSIDLFRFRMANAGMARTLIICPTHDHADTLFAAIASVRVQSDPDWELVVIGDGAPARTTEVMEAITSQDHRIRYEPHEKGPRLGEVYRDSVVRGTDSEFLCHLGDDDLWSEHHLASMTRMLDHADWAMQGTLQLMPDGKLRYRFANHAHPKVRAQAQQAFRPMLDGGINNVALRRSAYVTPGLGWETSVEGLGSDQFMWRKYLSHPDIRIAASADVTSLKFRTARERERMPPAFRLAEMTPLLAEINRAGEMSRMRAEADIVEPLFRHFYLTEAGHADTFEAGCSAAGLRPVPMGALPLTAVNGSIMDVPLTPAQTLRCRWGWALSRGAVGELSPLRDLSASFAGQRFFVLVSLRELAGFDPEAARTLARGIGEKFDTKFAEGALIKIEETVVAHLAAQDERAALAHRLAARR
ncbi:MAG: glycosyltransferase family A protein [Pseudomonadota bacterium]|nr:glycosyltransferase family A protein [Pseudomonadota bacterium]